MLMTGGTRDIEKGDSDARVSAWQTLTRIWHGVSWSGFALRHTVAVMQLVAKSPQSVVRPGLHYLASLAH